MNVPLIALDRVAPEQHDEMLATVGRIAQAGAFTLGEHVDEFEREFAAFCETGHAIGVSSGTDALALALRALGVGYGDEVIVPANSFIATAEAVALVGATPRLVDVDEETHLITAGHVEAAMNRRVRCVIPVHLYGSTVEMAPLLEVTRAAGVPVVEDACQAHGARYKGQRAGTLGDLGCFSFYPTKNLGAWGDAGAVVTADEELAARVRMLRSHGERTRYHHELVGTTARLDALQAAVLRIKLRDLDEVSEERRRLGGILRQSLGPLGVCLPPEECDGGDHVYHLFVVRTERRERLRAHLREHGVASAIHYPTPIHRTKAFASLGLGEGSLPACELLAQQVCTLPLFPGMTDGEVDRVVSSLAAWQDAEGLSAVAR